MIPESESTNTPITCQSFRKQRKSRPLDTTRVRIRAISPHSLLVEIYVPPTIASHVFSQRSHFDLGRDEQVSPLRWLLITPETPGRYARVSEKGARYRFAKVVRGEQLADLLGPFQFEPFSVIVGVHVEELDDMPGKKVLVLELEEALRGLLNRAEDQTALDFPEESNNTEEMPDQETNQDVPPSTDIQEQNEQDLVVDAPNSVPVIVP